jgi:peptide-methionine (R)-S-oxide reductase
MNSRLVFFLKLLSNLLLSICLRLSPSGFDITPWESDKLQRAVSGLPISSFSILREMKTEVSYTGRFVSGQRYNIKDEGFYVCATCGLPLFRSEHKFNSGTGWPSFFAVFDHTHIEEIISPDTPGYTEVRCARSLCHIGHAYPDKPPPALERSLKEKGIVFPKFCFVRYCVNAGALRFVPAAETGTLQ